MLWLKLSSQVKFTFFISLTFHFLLFFALYILDESFKKKYKPHEPLFLNENFFKEKPLAITVVSFTKKSTLVKKQKQKKFKPFNLIKGLKPSPGLAGLGFSAVQRKKARVKRNWRARRGARLAYEKAQIFRAAMGLKRESQRAFPGGVNMTCSGARSFKCSPQNEKIEKFLSHKWAMRQRYWSQTPSLQMDRYLGAWHLSKVN